MTGRQVYFPNELNSIIDRMGKGELSAICQKAVKEWDSYTENLDALKKKIAILEEEKATNSAALEHLKHRFQVISESEGERKQREELEKQKQQIESIETEKDRENKAFMYLVGLMRQKFILEEDIALDESKQYKEYESQCSMQGVSKITWVDWLDKKGYKRQPRIILETSE